MWFLLGSPKKKIMKISYLMMLSIYTKNYIEGEIDDFIEMFGSSFSLLLLLWRAIWIWLTKFE